MRIITGRARGIKLDTLEGEMTRPTAERTKEAVFSMIRFELEGRAVLDLFAGSGQMGLEAVSCGASSAVLCDKERAAVSIITKNVEKTRLGEACTVVCADYAECIRRMAQLGKRFDLVFLDPPYATTLVRDALLAMQREGVLKPTSLIVCESDKPDLVASDPILSEAFEVIKQNRYGIAYISLVTPKKEVEA